MLFINFLTIIFDSLFSLHFYFCFLMCKIKKMLIEKIVLSKKKNRKNIIISSSVQSLWAYMSHSKHLTLILQFFSTEKTPPAKDIDCIIFCNWIYFFLNLQKFNICVYHLVFLPGFSFIFLLSLHTHCRQQF